MKRKREDRKSREDRWTDLDLRAADDTEDEPFVPLRPITADDALNLSKFEKKLRQLRIVLTRPAPFTAHNEGIAKALKELCRIWTAVQGDDNNSGHFNDSAYNVAWLLVTVRTFHRKVTDVADLYQLFAERKVHRSSKFEEEELIAGDDRKANKYWKMLRDLVETGTCPDLENFRNNLAPYHQDGKKLSEVDGYGSHKHVETRQKGEVRGGSARALFKKLPMVTPPSPLLPRHQHALLVRLGAEMHETGGMEDFRA